MYIHISIYLYIYLYICIIIYIYQYIYIFATNCSTRYFNTICRMSLPFFESSRCMTLLNTLQHPATPCNTLQHTATHCNTQSSVPPFCDLPRYTTCRYSQIRCMTLCKTLQPCNTLQHPATHCNTLQHVALQHPATHGQMSILSAIPRGTQLVDIFKCSA